MHLAEQKWTHFGKTRIRQNSVESRKLHHLGGARSDEFKSDEQICSSCICSSLEVGHKVMSCLAYQLINHQAKIASDELCLN